MGKEKACLITPTLIGNIDFYKSAPKSWAEKAKESLEQSLQRIYTSNVYADRGNAFEKNLQSVAEKLRPPEGLKWGQRGWNLNLSGLNGSDQFKEVLGHIQGGLMQKKEGKEYNIAGERCFLYGRYDVWFEDLIIDIKTTEEFKRRKYETSFQHIQYLYVSGIDQFKYVVAEWDEYPKIRKVYTVDYTVEDRKTLALEVEQTVAEALDFLKSKPKYWDWYRDIFCIR